MRSITLLLPNIPKIPTRFLFFGPLIVPFNVICPSDMLFGCELLDDSESARDRSSNGISAGILKPEAYL